jgi:Ca2+-binding RTX toxin-like protein
LSRIGVERLIRGAPWCEILTHERDDNVQTDIENINGTFGADVLIGNDMPNGLFGRGDDVLIALGGDDVLFGEGGNDTLNCGAGIDTANGGPDTDSAIACESITEIP